MSSFSYDVVYSRRGSFSWRKLPIPHLGGNMYCVVLYVICGIVLYIYHCVVYVLSVVLFIARTKSYMYFIIAVLC